MRGLSLAALLCACVLVAGCGSTKKAAPPVVKVSAPVCAHPAGWRKLATRIDAPVYCPGWLPDPLSGQIGAVDNNINSVSKSDHSYLESWVWQDVDLGGTSGELHINLRGYPGRSKIPTCRTGGTESKNVPCFDQDSGTFTANGIHATEYTVNQDADQWHIAYVWHAYGGLYTISEHVAPPLTANKVVAYLRHQIRQLVVIKPGASA